MPLQGTLDAFSLDEVLELLAHARKTGALEVHRSGGPGGVLYFAGGRFCGGEAGELSGQVQSQEELETRLIDVCFVLLRFDQGEFTFEPDRLPPWPVRGGVDVSPIVQQVGRLIHDWNAIEDVIPSLDSCPTLVAELAREPLSLDRSSWEVVTAVDGKRNVREIARQLGRSVLEVSRVLKDLAEAGAATIDGQAAAVQVRRDPALEPELALPDLAAVTPSSDEPQRPTSDATRAESPPSFDIDELEAAQREAAKLAEGELTTAPGEHESRRSLVSDISSLAAAAAEAASMREGGEPGPGARSGTSPAESAASTESTVSEERGVPLTTGSSDTDPSDEADSADEIDSPDEPGKTSPKDRSALLRMFSGLRHD